MGYKIRNSKRGQIMKGFRLYSQQKAIESLEMKIDIIRTLLSKN